MKPKNTTKWLAASTAMLLSLGLLIPYLARATSNATATRLAGANRYATARAIAEATFTGGATNAVVASGTNHPDALAANFLTGAKAGPVILTDPTSLSNSPDTRTALFNLKVKNVTIVGGTEAVSAAVENELKTTNSTAGVGGTLVVDRIAGADRYETARKIAEAAGGTGGANVGLSNSKKTAIIATGEQFPDALAAGPAGYGKKFPIILTTTASLHAQASAALQSLGIQNVLIMGGINAVSQATEDAIKAINAITVERRFSGTNRQDTARQFADYAITNLGFGNTHVNLARGDNFPDALAGGPHAANDLSIDVILLTDGFVAGQNHLGTHAQSFLSARASTISSIHIFGGNQAVSDATVDAAIIAVGGTPSPTPTGTPVPTPTGGVGSGAQLRTGGPDLLSATVLEFTPLNGVPNTVRFTFDENVLAPVGGNFLLVGYDSITSIAGGAANISGSDPNSVIVQFGDAVDPRTFTLGTTASGAVTDGGGQTNVLASKPLAGTLASGTTGTTAGPDLRDTIINSDANQVTYIFDEQVTPGIVPTLFGFYDNSGTMFNGASVVAGVFVDRVTVQFGGAADVDLATRLFVRNGAVTGTGSGIPNPEGIDGGPTQGTPDLTGVTRVSGTSNQFDFTFDAAVQLPIPGNFAVYTDGATRIVGTGATQPGNLSTVRVTFGALNQNNANKVVWAAVDDQTAGVGDAAAQSTSTPNRDTTVGGVAITGLGVTVGAGFTDGPDLLSANYDAGGNSVTYNFDDNIDDTGTAVPGNFFVVNAGGVATAGAAIVDIVGKSITIGFPAGAVSSAAGAGVVSPVATQVPIAAGAAAQDFQGNANSPGSVGGGPAPGA